MRTFHADTQTQIRRARATPPQERPFNSMNQRRPSSARNSSIRRQAHTPPLNGFEETFSDDADLHVGTALTQALDPEPLGFIMRIRRCPLQQITSFSSAIGITLLPTAPLTMGCITWVQTNPTVRRRSGVPARLPVGAPARDPDCRQSRARPVPAGNCRKQRTRC